MIVHLLFVPVLLMVVAFAVIVRVITAPFRMGWWHRRRGWGGYGGGYGNYGGYGYRRAGQGVLTILAIVALERLFGRRY